MKMVTISTKNKSWITLMSEALLELTKNVFTGTGIKITTEGKRLLGSLRGRDTFHEKYASDKVANWCNKIERLEFTRFQPQAVYAFIHGVQST